MDFTKPEIFELREPDEKKDKHLVVNVTQDGKTRDYIVRLGSYSGVAPSLPEALHQLANSLDVAGKYAAEANTAKNIERQHRLRVCQYCDGIIFFARTSAGKWLPLDWKTVNAKELPSDFRAFGLVDQGGQPFAKGLLHPDGEVWIAHPEVCGIVEAAPEGETLSERWKSNRAKVLHQRDEAVDDLQRIVNDLSNG